MLETTMRQFIKHLHNRLRTVWIRLSIQRLAYTACQTPRHQAGRIKLRGLTIRYTDLFSCCIEYKDIFLRRIYHFETNTSHPFILDGGGCIGMSVLYFKRVYPEAKVICFEPDPDLMQVLRQNVVSNGLSEVELVQAGLAAQRGTEHFRPDGADGGKIIDSLSASRTIQTVRLSDYLDVPADFVKLNIEGQELPVLQEIEASGKFHNVRQLVLEYHGWPGGEQRLGAILELLDRNGFRYLVHDFDAESCGASKPPFHITPWTTWYCLVYAKRLNDEANSPEG